MRFDFSIWKLCALKSISWVSLICVHSLPRFISYIAAIKYGKKALDKVWFLVIRFQQALLACLIYTYMIPALSPMSFGQNEI